MTDFLPWINHLAASEAGVTLVEFERLTPDEQAQWKAFVVMGPSRLRDTLMIAEIRNLFLDFLTSSKKLTPVDEEWLDGVLAHPAVAWERRVEATKRRRREDRIKAARELYERERKAE